MPRPRRLPAALLLLAALTAGCGLTDYVGVTEPEPPVEIPKSSAAVLPLPPTDEVVAALGRVGAGLRLSGYRSGMRLRQATLTPETADALLLDLGLEAAPFGPALPLKIDEMTVLEAAREDSSASIYLLPHGDGDEIREFETGVVARPPDGTLLPVLRGRVSVQNSGYLLLLGDLSDRVLFASLIRTRLEGREVPAERRSIDAHELEVESTRLGSSELSRILADSDLPERGGDGGLASYRLEPRQCAAVREALRKHGEPVRSGPLTIRSDRGMSVAVDDLTLTVRTSFSPLDYGYLTEIRHGEGARTITEHADLETVLVLVWDADGPGESRGILIGLSPVE